MLSEEKVLLSERSDIKMPAREKAKLMMGCHEKRVEAMEKRQTAMHLFILGCFFSPLFGGTAIMLRCQGRMCLFVGISCRVIHCNKEK